MDVGISRINDWWNEVLKDADPRVDDYFMMSSALPSWIIVGLYLLFVWRGPIWMEKRKPFEINNILIVFNFFMIGVSGYVFYEFLASGWLAGYTLGCQLVDYSSSPQALRMVRVCWLFYFSKFFELFDTIFFVLRKKTKQISFLHVLHHAIMPVSWWYGVKFVAGGFGTFHSLLNSFIHFWMYTYYGMAAMGPSMQKYLWWKKYMTSMQITQFALVMLHTSQLLFTDCSYPKFFAFLIFLYAFVFIVMFFNFYLKTYKDSHKTKTQKSSKNGSVTNGIKSKKVR
ncbi:very long chain fatty acid elongase 7-like [Saccoglossus kowalevskii]|uniref:Elongation of very long chain fatty acids protein n=1 Tax=Saccoglossus kowalevskii TaxID=10224 RepID=A0ABM0MTP5_SACKO|nr:PREDICTED: elongation of very long chain fatty acids protein 7-like [Saccoglossus kowalevskii]